MYCPLHWNSDSFGVGCVRTSSLLYVTRVRRGRASGGRYEGYRASVFRSVGQSRPGGGPRVDVSSDLFPVHLDPVIYRPYVGSPRGRVSPIKFHEGFRLLWDVLGWVEDERPNDSGDEWTVRRRNQETRTTKETGLMRTWSRYYRRRE